MSTQAASTRPMNRPMNDPQNPAMMRDTQQMPSMRDGHRDPMPSPGTETKQAFLTTEFWVYAAAVALVVIAAFWRGSATDGLNINDPNRAWLYLTILTGGYLVSRGLSKAGSARRSGKERNMR
ncbi:hypothetical protein [Micromonospora sp. NPDC049645]|uniref:hypothetical protein n=1 Tax=Micromonospora sp. NPDC049645 TaxID=3155508 RepID=UPI003437F75E